MTVKRKIPDLLEERNAKKEVKNAKTEEKSAETEEKSAETEVKIAEEIAEKEARIAETEILAGEGGTVPVATTATSTDIWLVTASRVWL